MQLTYYCEILLDQGHYIGDDPIGHACGNEAAFEWNNVAVCRSCKIIIEQAPERITYPVFGTTLAERIAAWHKYIQVCLDSYKEKNPCCTIKCCQT